jgi:hypothetical protein
MAFTGSVTGTATWPATLPCPANGNADNAINNIDMLQRIANGLVYLRSSQFTVNLLASSAHYLNDFSQVAAMEQAEALQQDAVAGVELFKLALPTPATGLSIDAISLKLKGAGGHAWPLGFVPFFQLYSKAMSAMDGAWGAAAAAVNDPSGSAVAYQAIHVVEQTADVAMSTANAYELRVYGESGANALVGLVVYGATITYKF